MVITKMTFAVIICILFMIGLSFIYFSKKRINNEENKLYRLLLILNLIGLIFHLLADYVSYNYNFLPLYISTFVLKTYLIYYFAYGTLLLAYLCIISNLKYKDVYVKCLLVTTIIIYILLYFLPQEIYINMDKMIFYTHGLDVKVIYTLSGIVSILLFIIILTKLNKLDKKKALPLFLFMIGATISIIIQNQYPDIVIIDCVESVIVLLMYFTIENPDLKMLREMELAKNTAEKANRAKSDFLSSMSHEIRTPLNAIVGLSEDIASYKEQVPKEVIEDTEDIQNASQTLLEIVGNILDINKIESEKMEIVEIPYNYVEEIEKMARVTATRIGDKPIDFKINFAPDIPCELLGDKAHIKEIANNLLTNAIKYTEKGTITLNTKCINQNDKCMLIISVQDTGRGIKAENINKLFTKFERLDVEKNTTTEGTGLGLAITKALVDMMGGHINVQSQFGEGSIFVVQIPQKISKMVNPIQENQNTSQTEIEIIKPESSDIYEKQNSNKKVLVVDDNKLNIKVARKHLESLGYIVDESESGEQCLDKINKGEKYDLILMDIMMPEMSGETTLRKLKEDQDFNIPVIALTADAVSGAKERYEEEGFIDYIAKPFTKEEIKNKLERIFFNYNQNSIKKENNLINEDSNSDTEEATYVFDPKVNEEYVIIDGKRKDVIK